MRSSPEQEQCYRQKRTSAKLRGASWHRLACLWKFLLERLQLQLGELQRQALQKLWASLWTQWCQQCPKTSLQALQHRQAVSEGYGG